MGPITAIPAGVSFSLTCQFVPQTAAAPEEAPAAVPADGAKAQAPPGT